VRKKWLRRELARLQPSSPHHRDFASFASDCRIKTKTQGVIRFSPDIWHTEQKLFEKNRTGRDIVLKGRQIGFTTLELMRGLYLSSTRDSFNTVVVGHDHLLVQDIFANVRFAADGLESEGKLPKTSQDTVRQIRFESTGSSISVTEAGATERTASKKGHSGTIHRLHATEVARWAEPEVSMEGLLGAVPPEGEVVLESVAAGAGGYFHNRVKEALEGRGRYKLHFYPWFIHDPYRTQPRDGFDPDPVNSYEELLRGLGCDDSQIQWWRDRVEDFGTHRALGLFPPNPELAFRVTGNTYYDQEVLDELAELVRPPSDMVIVRFKGTALGELLVYKTARKGRKYVVGGDVSEGIDGDAHSAHVLDWKTGETVATFHNARIEPGDFGLAMAVIGRRYNMAAVGPERNNHGHSAIRALKREAKYPNIYRADDGKDGWLTNKATRPPLFDELYYACRSGSAWTPDAGTYHELTTLVIGPDGKPVARDKGKPDGCADDRPVSWGIAWQMRSRPQTSLGLVHIPNL